MGRRLFRLPLVSKQPLASGYWVLRFGAGEGLEASAGQFAMVRSCTWDVGPLLPRPMSLLDAGPAPAILIKVIGLGTRRMAEAAEGELFDLLAPLGVPWPAPPPEHRPLLVAGGVGVAPLVFLAETLTGRAPLSLYGGRTRHDLPLAERLGAAGELRVCTEDGSRGHRGRVTELLAQALDELGDAPVTLYTCGPHAMMAAVAAIAAARGVLCHASLEAPMGCGYGVCLGCPVPREGGGYLYACVDGPCVDARVVDWSRGVFA